MHPLLQDCCFVYPLKIHWGDMDAFQHVNNTQYFRYFEHARMGHFEQIGLMDLLETHNQSAIIAEIRCRFKAPLTYPDNIWIGVKVADLQKDQFTHRYTVVSERLDRIAAEGDARVVFYDYSSMGRCDLPPHHYQLLQQQAVGTGN